MSRTLLPWSILVHRWAGLLVGVPALLWFGSAVVMHIWTDEGPPTKVERLSAYEPLTPAAVAGVGFPQTDDDVVVGTVMLQQSAGRLVWQIEAGRSAAHPEEAPPPPGPPLMLDARTGAPAGPFSPDQAALIAARVAALDMPPARMTTVTKEGHLYYGGVPLPAYRYSFDDAQNTDIYIDPATGAVAGTIATPDRIRRYFGTIPHFFQFTPPGTFAREHLINPARILALTAMLAASVAGLIYGIWLLQRRSRNRQNGRSPRPTLKYVVGTVHNWIGIASLAVVIAWTVSGYTMFLWFPRIQPDPAEAARLAERPVDFAGFAITPAQALAAAGTADAGLGSGAAPVSRIGLRRLLDRPVYDVIRADNSSTLVDGTTGAVLSPLPDTMVAAIAGLLLGRSPEIRSIAPVGPDDDYLYSKPNNPVRAAYRVDLADGLTPSPIYVDAEKGTVLGRVDGEFRAFRWVGQALHTFDFPALLSRPALWGLAVIIPSIFIVVLSATGLWLGAKHVVALARRRVAQAAL